MCKLKLQQYGQFRIPRHMFRDFGAFAKLVVVPEGLQLSPFQDGGACRICKIYDDRRICIPVRLRRAAGIREYVKVEELEGGTILITPAATDGESDDEV